MFTAVCKPSAAICPGSSRRGRSCSHPCSLTSALEATADSKHQNEPFPVMCGSAELGLRCTSSCRSGPGAILRSSCWIHQHADSAAAAVQEQPGMETSVQAEAQVGMWHNGRRQPLRSAKHQRSRCVRAAHAGHVTTGLQQHQQQGTAPGVTRTGPGAVSGMHCVCSGSSGRDGNGSCPASGRAPVQHQRASAVFLRP
ncbi:hypothetical protein COO60DRAFT_1596639 [Scenedesmus sp. NREL 46B-D3]|nr:hypothetical protein COO60DRAFT_1596639 [Scenedesmus sp. NREL 46B-D3]